MQKKKKNKVLLICGSPRKGNTEFLLNKVKDGVEKSGGEAELILLREKHIQHCDGNDYCVEHKKCNLIDEMQEIYPKLIDANAIVFGTPNYFNNVSGLMKDFIDRTNPLWSSQALEGKKAALVIVGGHSLPSIDKCEECFLEYLRIKKMVHVGSIKVMADKPEESEGKDEEIQQAIELGEKLGKKEKE